MINLLGKYIKLRALEPEDLNTLFKVENNTSLWEVSATQTPFSKAILEAYINQSHRDIYEAKQLRLIIATKSTNTTVGLVDLFQFEPQHKRAGIGIYILNEYQNQGYAKDAVSTTIEYAINVFDLHQIYANIISDNTISIKLFESLNFKKSGIKKDWIYSNQQFKDVLLYQYIKPQIL